MTDRPNTRDIQLDAIDEALKEVVKQFARNYFDDSMELTQFEAALLRAATKHKQMKGN
jgi:hypothetical protein